MSSKDKAKELVDKFYNDIISQYEESEGSYDNARQCAKICVDEMILQLDKGRSISVDVYLNQRNNLIEVKQEIEKL